MPTERNDKSMDDDHQEYIAGNQEKTSIGGEFNSGVTSRDPREKEEIEKKASLANVKQPATPRDKDPEGRE